MTTRSIKIDTAWKKAVLVIAALAFIPAAWMIGRWCVASSAVERADDAELAVYLTGLGPDDPLTHHAAAVYLEKSFDPQDIEKALREYEAAAALAPENYVLWLDLGRARERSGDASGAEIALRRASMLAPNYSRVRWALGNALLRQGRIEEAFAEIRQVVAGDPSFAGPAAIAAWQFFEGDVVRIRASMGALREFDAALSVVLANEKRFDDALNVWRELPSDAKRASLRKDGETIRQRLLEAKRFRDAANLSGELGESSSFKIGEITNGGFELAVKPEGADTFDWNIAAGLQPQIVLSNSQKHGGNNSLLLVFNTTSANEFRSVSQTIAVEPSRRYELEIYYHADLKTSAIFKWEVVLPGGAAIAATGPIASKADWTRASATFEVPATSDAVVIRLVRESCPQVCAVTGSLWFDDVSLKTLDR